MAIPRTVVVAQGKGGVGKTSVATNVAGLAAAGGLRACIVDLDPQGNTRRDLGMPANTGDDLLGALIQGAPMPRVRDVRPGLDVVPGGPAVGDLAGLMYARASRGGTTLTQTLHDSLGAIAGDYDLVMIDTPPGEKVLVEAAMGVASAVVIPTRSDEASIDGMEVVAERFVHARTTNPDLRLAGVLIFAVGVRSGRLERRVRATISEMLGDAAPVFETRIRDLQSAAVDARGEGLLVHELEGAAVQASRDRLAALHAGEKPEGRLLVSSTKSASGLAEDYANFTRELLARVGEILAETSGVSA